MNPVPENGGMTPYQSMSHIMMTVRRIDFPQ